MDLYFITVNYNNSNYTAEYIKSVMNINKDSTDNVKIVVIDNNSKQEDKIKLKKICEEYKAVKVIWSNSNIGYFKGLNLGIDSINKKNMKTFIIGNNDITFDENFFINYKKIQIDAKDLVLAPDVITKDGRHQNPHVLNNVHWVEKIKTRIYYSNYYLGQLLRIINQFIKSRMKPVSKETNLYQSRIKIKRGIGACYILTPYYFKHIDRLDDRLFLWGEEVLFSKQVEDVKGHIIYEPSLVVHHHESASVSKIEKKSKYYITKESYKIYGKYL